MARNKQRSERNKITDLGENIATLFTCTAEFGAWRPKADARLKRRGDKSQEEAQVVHNPDPSGVAAEGQGAAEN